MTKINQNQEVELQNKAKEISHHINNAETLNDKIRELNSKIRVMTENEVEYQRDQAENRKEIEDLEASLSSQSHTEQILYNDLEEARKEIAKLTTQANHTSLESQQEESAASEESNTLDNNEDEKAEDTSLVWDHSVGSFLLGKQGEECHSTPKPKEPLCNNELENNQKHYENTAEISGLENSRNELLEEMTSA